MTTTNTQHTPGPWVIGEQIINEYGVVVTSIDAPNAEPNEVTNLANVFGDEPEDSANAQLIARAPELLKENEQLKRDIEERDREQGRQLKLNAELLEASKKVVKALKDSIRVNGQVCMTAGIAFSIDEDLQKAIAKAEGKH